MEGGNVHNDWWVWEQLPGKIKDGSRSGDACDHYNRYAQDFADLALMGHNAHRLSIEWSRIEPAPGAIDADAVAHYRDVLETLRRLGMEPLVSLHHFTNPQWLAARGGWAQPSTVDAFRGFARLCAAEYGDLVKFWATFNEPNVYAYFGFFNGEWPPQKKDFATGVKVFRNLLRGHAAAYEEMKAAAHGTSARVGIAQHLRYFHPARPWLPLDRAAMVFPELGFNQWFLRGCTDGFAGFPLGTRERVPEAAGTLDYIGVNYYGRDLVAFDPRSQGAPLARVYQNPRGEKTEFDWEIYPQGLYPVLTDTWKRYGKPIYITENGVADRHDRMRTAYLISHLAETARAIRAGADVRGYLHWTSMDNFEWAEGYSMAFGLQEVDFATQARRPRPSAEVYSRIIAERALRWKDLQDHYPRGLPYFVGTGSRRVEAQQAK